MECFQIEPDMFNSPWKQVRRSYLVTLAVQVYVRLGGIKVQMREPDGQNLVKSCGSCIQKRQKHQIPFSCPGGRVWRCQDCCNRFTGKPLHFLFLAFLAFDKFCFLI